MRVHTAVALVFLCLGLAVVWAIHAEPVEVAKCRSPLTLPAPESACSSPGYGKIDEAAPTLFASSSTGEGAQYLLPKDAPASAYVAAVDPAVYQRVWVSKLAVVDIAGVRFAVPTVGATATLTWDAPAGAAPTGYRVYVAKDGGAAQMAGTTAADGRRFVWQGLAPGAYVFSVASLAGSEESDPVSAAARVDQARPGQPTNVSISITVAP